MSVFCKFFRCRLVQISNIREEVEMLSIAGASSLVAKATRLHRVYRGFESLLAQNNVHFQCSLFNDYCLGPVV